MKLPWKKKQPRITAMALYRKSSHYHTDEFHFGKPHGDVWIRVGKGLAARWTHVLVCRDRMLNKWYIVEHSAHGKMHHPIELPKTIDNYWQDLLDYNDAHPGVPYGTGTTPKFPFEDEIVEKPGLNGDLVLKLLSIALIIVVAIFTCLTLLRFFLFLSDRGLL